MSPAATTLSAASPLSGDGNVSDAGSGKSQVTLETAAQIRGQHEQAMYRMGQWPPSAGQGDTAAYASSDSE